MPCVVSAHQLDSPQPFSGVASTHRQRTQPLTGASETSSARIMSAPPLATPRIADHKVKRRKGAMKHKRSISLLATAALFAGFLAVTPPDEVMPVAVADPPITHTFWVVYATHDAIDDSTREDFLSTANLNAIIDRAEAY